MLLEPPNLWSFVTAEPEQMNRPSEQRAMLRDSLIPRKRKTVSKDRGAGLFAGGWGWISLLLSGPHSGNGGTAQQQGMRAKP